MAFTGFIRLNNVMKDTKYLAILNQRIFTIEPDLPEVGVYLRIFEGDKDIADYLQNSVEDCIEFASRKFAVPKESWSAQK